MLQIYNKIPNNQHIPSSSFDNSSGSKHSSPLPHNYALYDTQFTHVVALSGPLHSPP